MTEPARGRGKKAKHQADAITSLDEDELDALVATRDADAIISALSQQLKGKSNPLIRRAFPIAVRSALSADVSFPATALALQCYESLMQQGKKNKMEVHAVRLMLETVEGLATGGERWGGDPLLSLTIEDKDRARGDRFPGPPSLLRAPLCNRQTIRRGRAAPRYARRGGLRAWSEEGHRADGSSPAVRPLPALDAWVSCS